MSVSSRLLGCVKSSSTPRTSSPQNDPMLSQLFGQGYSQGAQFTYAMDNMRFMGGAFDGIGGQNNFTTGQYNSQNTNWDDTPTNYAFAGRADFKISGDWSQFDSFSSFNGEEAGMMAGVAVAYERGNWNVNRRTSHMASRNSVSRVTSPGTSVGASLFASAVWVNTDDPNRLGHGKPLGRERPGWLLRDSKKPSSLLAMSTSTSTPPVVAMTASTTASPLVRTTSSPQGVKLTV